MGKDLFATFPEAMEALCLAQKIFRTPALNDSREKKISPADTGPEDSFRDLADLIFALPPHIQDPSAAESLLRHTRAAQVALGAVSLAMTRVLQRFGVRPDMTCGHSFGELAALHAAGWMDDTTLLTLAAVRGHYMAAAGDAASDSGSMLAVKALLGEIEHLIAEELPDLILANLRQLHDAGAKIIVRCPLIPQHNARPEHLDGIVALSRQLPRLEGVELLPYYDLWRAKLARFGLASSLPETVQPPDRDTVNGWNAYLRRHGVRIVSDRAAESAR
jgi:hypothetical protein